MHGPDVFEPFEQLVSSDRRVLEVAGLFRERFAHGARGKVERVEHELVGVESFDSVG